MSGTGSIDTSGRTPTVNVERFVSTALATVLWGYYNGLLGFARRATGGVFSTVDAVGAWLRAPAGSGPIRSVLAIPVNALDAATAANAAFLSGLGIWGQAVAVVEGVAVLLAIILAMEYSIKAVVSSV